MRIPTTTSTVLVVASVIAIALMLPSNGMAAVIFELNMDGAQEVPGPGDPDGTASGTLLLDESDGTVSWDFTYQNINAPIAMHIHGPGGSAGSSAGVFIGLGIATSGGPGTLIDSLIAPIADVQAVLANPTDFYVNIHTDDFRPGAVRGQLGERIPLPSTAALLVLGVAGLLGRRRG